jgi:hypothetical protein
VRAVVPERPFPGYKRERAVAGFISRIQRSPDGKTYGFTVYDETNRPSLYLGFSDKVEADRAAQQMTGVLATARQCQQR